MLLTWKVFKNYHLRTNFYIKWSSSLSGYIVGRIMGILQLSNIALNQRRQSKVLHISTNAHWYVNNQTLLNDLRVLYIKEVISERSIKYHQKLKGHPNTLHPLTEATPGTRLEYSWP